MERDNDCRAKTHTGDFSTGAGASLIGTNLIKKPTGRPNEPIPMQNSHSLRFRDSVEVNSPPNSIIKNCMTMVKTMINRKVVFLNSPSKTLNSGHKRSKVEMPSTRKQKKKRKKERKNHC